MINVELNILPMKSGDCIHLRFGGKSKWYNIVIDSGPAGCTGKFRSLLKQIEKSKEVIDLMCFTHIDDDHIKGAERVFSSGNFNPKIIKEIWINLPLEKNIVEEKNGSYTPLTVKNACKLWYEIKKHNLQCKTHIIQGDKIKIGNAEIQVLLPTEKRLLALKEYWDEEIEKWNKNNKYLLLEGFKEDDSPTNGSSITLLILINDKKFLFAGDAFPKDLETVCKENIDNELFLVKLPHHGSKRNITQEMLETMKCRNFFISTNQTAYRPAQETIKLLSEYGKKCGGIKLYGNYKWTKFQNKWEGMEIIALKEKKNVEGIVIFSEEYGR